MRKARRRSCAEQVRIGWNESGPRSSKGIFHLLYQAGVYSNYLVIHAALVSVFGILVQVMIPSIGNSVATEPPAKNLRDMRRFDFAYTAAAGWAATCLLCLWSPFVGLWAGEGSVLG